MLHNMDGKRPKTAILMEVFKVNSKDLHKKFVEYDTVYFDLNRWEYYKIPDGEVLVLLLQSLDMIWTTIRRYTPEKFEYYKNSRWEEFEIQLKEVESEYR